MCFHKLRKSGNSSKQSCLIYCKTWVPSKVLSSSNRSEILTLYPRSELFFIQSSTLNLYIRYTQLHHIKCFKLHTPFLHLSLHSKELYYTKIKNLVTVLTAMAIQTFPQYVPSLSSSTTSNHPNYIWLPIQLLNLPVVLSSPNPFFQRRTIYFFEYFIFKRYTLFLCILIHYPIF